MWSVAVGRAHMICPKERQNYMFMISSRYRRPYSWIAILSTEHLTEHMIISWHLWLIWIRLLWASVIEERHVQYDKSFEPATAARIQLAAIFTATVVHLYPIRDFCLGWSKFLKMDECRMKTAVLEWQGTKNLLLVALQPGKHVWASSIDILPRMRSYL